MSEEMLIQSLENIFAPINVSQVVSHEDVNGGGMGNVLQVDMKIVFKTILSL